MGRICTCPQCGGTKSHRGTLCRRCRFPNYGTGKPRTRLHFKRWRAEAGIIVTFVDGAGVAHVNHYPGPPETGLKTACATADHYGWKIRTTCTPSSILGDLNGRKPGRGGGQPLTPETSFLSKVGRMDLYDPPAFRWGL